MTDRYENIRRALEMLESDDVYKRALGHATLRDQCHPDIIRALLEEVERLQDSVNRLGLEGGQFMSRTATAEARAERLAEALREAYGQVRELCDCYGHVYPEASFVRYEALLREQEDGE